MNRLKMISNNWKRLIILCTGIIIIITATLASCVKVYPSNSPQTFPTPTSTLTTIVFNPALSISTITTTTTEDVPLPRIEAFIADPSYNPGGSRLSKLGDAKIAVDTAWQRLSPSSYYSTVPSLTDKYRPWDMNALQKALSEFRQTSWTSLYKVNYFDCSDMSALLQRELSIRGFESWIVIGKDPIVSSGHAWVVVFLKSPTIQLVPVEATALSVPIPGSKYTFTNGVVQTYEDYSRQGWVLQDIYQAIAWWSAGEFDYWNRADILQKLNLPTLVSTSTPTPTFTPIPAATITITPASGLVGTALTVSGTNFPANTALTCLWDSMPFSPTSGSTATNNAGIFVNVYIVPQTTAGSHIITAIAGSTSAATTFIVTVPPTTPTTTTLPTYTTTTPTSTTTPVTTTTPSQIPQHIEASMQGAPIFGYSYLNYTKYLNTGDVINGTVQLIGKVYPVDNSYEWQFQILGPGGESIKLVTLDFRNTTSLSFNVKASYAGTYRIRITHKSANARMLIIDLTPAGWAYANLG